MTLCAYDTTNDVTANDYTEACRLRDEAWAKFDACELTDPRYWQLLAKATEAEAEVIHIQNVMKLGR